MDQLIAAAKSAPKASSAPRNLASGSRTSTCSSVETLVLPNDGTSLY